MEPSASDISNLLSSAAAYPVAAIIIGLVVAVVYLWRSQRDLEREFRTYAMEQGARTSALLDRATKALESIETTLLSMKVGN